MRRKFLLSWFLMLLLITGNFSILNAQVAKVGNTEYATIDEAIANWTNGTTLTLLADVTLSDVIKLSSTEYHILDLSTFTMTAASGKDAIQYVVNGRSSASYALDIKADANNPGGITATGKTIVSHIKPSSNAPSKDRPITRFYGGVFNASYVVKQGGNGVFLPGAGYTGASAPYFQFYGGVFNGTIYLNRSQTQFHGGVFNGSIQMSVDTSAYGLVAGGTFKNLSNSMGSALNSDKFTIGSAKGVYDRDVYIDDNGNYVIVANKPDPGEDGIQADVPKTPGTNDYLAYSRVASEEKLGYTKVEKALNDNKSASVTVYADEIDMSEVTNFSGTIVVPADHAITITNAPANLNVVDEDGNAITPNENGTYTTVEPAGNNFTGYTGEDGIWGEVWGNAFESFVIKVLDANGNVMGTTSLNNVDGIIDGDVNVTWNIKLDAASNTDEYWTMAWTTAPTIDNMPAKVELWVDGVKVSGGNVVLNGPDEINKIYAAVTDANGKILSYHTSIANAVAAAQDKDVIEIIKEGNYTLPEFAGKELTFKGSSRTGTSITDWVNKGSQGMMGSTVHFENLTISGQTENYYGLFHTNAVTYKDCNINGLRFLYSPTTFEDCAFNANGVEHSFWTYGASNVTVTGCTFTYTDRAVNCYSENDPEHELVITFEGCSFTYAGTNDAPEGAVEINSSSVKSIKLVMNGCTAPAKGAMWFNSQWDSTGGLKTEVVVDGDVVWTAPAKIGETKYATLAAAYEAAVNGDVIVLNESVTTFPVIEKAVTFKGGKENAAVEINYALSQNFTAIDGIVRFENLTFNKPLFTEHGGNKPGLSIEFEGCNFNVNSEAAYGILIGTSWSNSVVKGLKVNNCNFKYVGTEFKGGYMLYVQCVNEVTITNNTIDGNNLYRGAIHLGDATEHATVATVSNNTIKNFCRGVMMGNRKAPSSATISGNTFDNINYSDKDNKPAQECAPIFIHSNATAEALQIALTDNEVENCANPMIYSEDTDLIKYYVTEFTGNTVDGAAVELANSYYAPNQIFPVATINDAEYFTLQAAVNAVQNGETITLLSDITEEIVNIEKASGVTFIMDGSKGTRNSNSNWNFTGELEIGIGESITIKNINFVATDEISPEYFIDCMDKNSNCVLTITGCNFTDTDYSTVAIGTHHPTQVVIDGCNATGVHSLLQNQGGYDITVKNTTVDGKRGMSLGTVKGATVENVKIIAADDKYGIRLNGEISDNTITIKNCEVKAFIPVVVRKAQVESYNVIFEGTNTMTQTNTDGLWCAIGTSEYETNGTMPTAPTGQVTVTLNDTGLSMDGVYGAFFPVKIGETGYATLAAAAAAAQAGDEILLLADVTLSEALTTPADITLNGNGKQINGTINAGGALTIKGHTKVTNFGAGSGDVITIGEGACLEINGTGRMVIGHGATFNITGNITDAKTANVAELTPSLIMPGASFTGAGVTFNVTNAYINVPSSYCSTKPSEASGIFDFNITNSIWESAGKLAFEEATVNAKVDFALLNSVLVTGSHLVFGTASGEEGVVIDNSNVNVGTSRQIENCGTMTVKNGSVVNGAVATSSNAKNPGTLIVDNATYAVTGEFSGSDLGTGTLIVNKTANFSAGSITKANIQIDVTGMNAGDEVKITTNLTNHAGTIEVINNNMLDAKIVDGKIVIVERTLQGEGTEASPYLINDVDDLVWLQEKVDKLTQDGSTQFAGKYFKLTNDIDLSGINWNPIGTMNGDHGSFKGVFDGGDHTISNLYVEQAGDGIGLFARTTGNAVIKNLKLNNVTVKSTNNSNYVGGLVGNAYASTKIENVHVSGNVYISGRGYIGGIAGHGYVVMDNVSVVATGDGLGNAKGLITSTFWCAGGVLGYAGEGATNIMNAQVENVVVTSAAGCLGAIVGMAEDNNGTQPISGSNLSAKNVEIKTYIGAYGDAYANYALGYLYGGNPTSILTGDLSVEVVTIKTSTGEAPEVNDAVAQIGSSIYFNLQDALNADGNVTVLRDIALTEGVTVAADKTVVLDLKGKTISMVYTTSDAENSHVILNSGILTIKSSADGGKISYESYNGPDLGTSYAANAVRTLPGSVLTVESGTIENLVFDNATVAYAIDGLTNGGNGDVTVNIEGGVITSKRQAVRIFANSTTNTGTLNISGGEFTGRVIVQNANANANKAALNISGGTFNKNDYKVDVLYVGGSQSATIDIEASVTGGTFKGIITETHVTNFISGGTFSSDVSVFCAEGFKVEQNTDGTYGVVPFETKEYVIAANGEIKTLADAIAKAKEDGTDIVTYTIYGAATLETGGSHGIVDFGGREGYITIKGGSGNTRSTDSFTITGGGVPDIKGVTFKDLTFYDEGTYLPTANEFMYQNFIDCTFENVTFEDGIRLSGNSVVRNCTFNANTNDEYAIWLDEGTFEMTGSTVTAGNDAYGLLKSDEVDKITISDNTFQYLAKVNKEALNVKDAIIVAEDNTFIDCAKGVVPTDKTNYTEDGETIITNEIIAVNNTVVVYVAKINDTKYESLAEAVTAASNNATIELLWAEGHTPIAMNASLYGKNVTITGTATVDWSNGFLFVGRGGAGDAILTFDGANLTSASDNASTGIHVSGREKNTDNKYDGTVIIKNSTIELDYLINKGTMTLDNSTLTVKNGFSVGGRPASETESGVDATATITLSNNSKVVVNDHNGMGLGYEAIGVMNIDATSTFETTQAFLVTAKGTMNVNGGNVKVVGTLTNAGTVYVTGTANLDANVTGNGWFYMNGVTLDADTKLLGAKVGFINGVNTIKGSTIDNGFFSVGIGQNAAATTAAAFAGANDITLDDVTVNVSENAIIGGNGETYSGWVGSAYSADKTQHTYTLNVENSLAAFGYMHVSKDGIMNINGRSADDNKYTQDNSNVNFYAGDLIVNGNVTINNADAWVKFTKMSVDHADGVLNITGDTKYESSIHNGGTTSTSLVFYKAGKVNIANGTTIEIDNATTLVEGAELNIASSNVIAKGDVTGNGAINFTALTAKLTAQEDLTIVDEVDNPNYAIAYLDGTYQYAEYVAQIGEAKYLTLKEAIEAAQNDETITLLVDVSQADGVIIDSKNIVVDLNEKTFTVTEGASTNNRNFKITGTSVVTIKNGIMIAAGDYSSGAYGTVRTEGTAEVTLTGLKLYNYRGNGLNIKACEGTIVNISNTEIYSQYGGGIEAEGGIINIAETVKVEQKGMYTAPYNSMAISVNNGGTVTVAGGTYSTECIAAEDANGQGTSHGPWVVGVLNSGGTLIINGGTFSNDNFGDNSHATAARGAVLADAKANVQINGGTFNALAKIIDIQNNIGGAANNPVVTLKGGTYSADPTDGNISNCIVLAEGYSVKPLDNGYYTVIQTAGTQTFNMEDAGWYWFSTYIKFATEGEGLDALKDALDDDASLIKGQYAFTNYLTYNNTSFWTSGNNALTTLSPSQMYMINTTSDNVEVDLTGAFLDYEAVPVTINVVEGWNWIGYPVSEEVNINNAIPNAKQGDVIKSQFDGYAMYYENYPYNNTTLTGWYGELTTLKPGRGYMYQASEDRQFSYNKGNGNGAKSNIIDYNGKNYWFADATQYPNNMSIVAMLSIDGEIVKGNYEVAAFANGECRGSARPIYIEAIDTYVLYMTIYGDEVEELTFMYYDIDKDTEYELNNVMNYSNDAIVGALSDPYIFSMNILGIGENSIDNINIYPNPTTTDREINLQAMCDKVEVFNALGVKVAEYHNVDTLDALETAGIYVIRITIDGNARNCRLVVK